VGWPASMGSGSPIKEDDESITHVIIDRPVGSTSTKLVAKTRKFVQPQWIVDSINAQKCLPEGPYAQGATLPPHLSPFGEEYQHIETEAVEAVESDSEDEAMEVTPNAAVESAAAAIEVGDSAALRAAELAAERAGVSTEDFDTNVGKVTRKKPSKTKEDPVITSRELEMNKMLMSNKQRKLFERVRHSEKKKNAEREILETKRLAIQKSKAKDLRRAVRSSTVVE